VTELLLKVIENEIVSGMMFVAVAQSAYRASKFSDGSLALSKAEASYLHAAHLANGLTSQESEAVERKLQQLRSSIECLMRSNVN
jgi:hypothetical protein